MEELFLFTWERTASGLGAVRRQAVPVEEKEEVFQERKERGRE